MNTTQNNNAQPVAPTGDGAQQEPVRLFNPNNPQKGEKYIDFFKEVA